MVEHLHINSNNITLNLPLSWEVNNNNNNSNLYLNNNQYHNNNHNMIIVITNFMVKVIVMIKVHRQVEQYNYH